MDASKKLSALRAEITKQNLDGFIVPHADEYLNEYLPASAESLAWLTNFTGSSGEAVILKDRALVLTDSRYTIQIVREVDSKLYEIGDMATLSVGDWLAANAAGEKIGYDPRLHTRKQIEKIEEKIKGKKISLHPVDQNPLYEVWTDRPSVPQSLAELFPDAVAGATSAEKRHRIADDLKREKISAVIITDCDGICWLLNVRGDDVPYNPLVLSRLVLHVDGTADWYVDERKVPQQVADHLGGEVRMRAPENFETDLAKLKGPVQVDPARSPLLAEMILEEKGIETIDGKSPCVFPKSIKTPSEQLWIKKAHIRDGVAVTLFLHWLDCQDFDRETHTEISLAEKLEDFRKGQDGYRGPSFPTISGWASNGAVVHYRAVPETNLKITGNNFLLLDSGAQYEYGTTDITRTIVIGKVTDEMKDRFTRVLKGHIAVSSAVMDDAMDGATLDALARSPLKAVGLDYGHGTGHGVGCYLCVHEDSTRISPMAKDQTFKPGMLLSDEPGYYLKGQYGIRHENLILCHEREDGKLYWEPVTLVPFDLRGVEWGMMTADEIQWLRDYHERVFAEISPFLYSEAVDWLREFCFSYFKN
ncbi:MAG TPA: aminopeptidase P family protein [Alphaproteobacteria bacterium]|nr:aminopeptidase P family protein [Alphaproteobacteria bacterium]HNS45101.1 aminopeptidase P family protein [Alphaproteobacteria bacterium]